jgi:hypothetical protein
VPESGTAAECRGIARRRNVAEWLAGVGGDAGGRARDDAFQGLGTAFAPLFRTGASRRRLYAETIMLTREQLQLLKQIHAGAHEIAGDEAQDLLDRGLIERQGSGFDVTQQGRQALGLREGFGDAIVDAVLPGEGARQAEEKH